MLGADRHAIAAGGPVRGDAYVMFKDINDLLDRIPIWKRLQGLAGRMDALETRIAELEARLAVAPGETCQFCGRPSVWMIEAGAIQDEGPNAWRRERWQCASCYQFDERIKRL